MPSASTDGTGPSLLLHDEAISVGRRRVVGDTIRVETMTQVSQRQVEVDLTHERVLVEHVPIGRIVDSVPDVRTEGDVTIVPVVEEIVVIERRLVLKEEIHMRRVRTSERHQETVALRRQEAIVTRLHVEQDASSTSQLTNNHQEKAHG